MSRHIHIGKANNILSEINTSNLQFSVATSVSWSELGSGAKCGFAEKHSRKASSTGIQVIRPGGIGQPDVDPQQLRQAQGWGEVVWLCVSHIHDYRNVGVVFGGGWSKGSVNMSVKIDSSPGCYTTEPFRKWICMPIRPMKSSSSCWSLMLILTENQWLPLRLKYSTRKSAIDTMTFLS